MDLKTGNPFEEKLSNCDFCMRLCQVNRFEKKLGYCKSGVDPLVASICLHTGEEPVLSGSKGVCNVFFGHCNMACMYCQNYQISRNSLNSSLCLSSYDQIVESIKKILDRGVKHLGFVSPTHQVFQMCEIIKRVKDGGYNPIVIYNTNALDNPKTICDLDGIVDIYLPDIKYFSNELSQKYSDTKDYFQNSMLALKEMVWQKGTSLILDDEGLAISGVIVRHLVLPGSWEDSIKVLKGIAEGISANLHISLMAQYYPTENAMKHPELSRFLNKSEYEAVKESLYRLGFSRGWVQEMESSGYYQPNFFSPDPFKT